MILGWLLACVNPRPTVEADLPVEPPMTRHEACVRQCLGSEPETPERRAACDATCP